MTNTTRQHIGSRLYRLALTWSHDEPVTQAARNAAVKSVKGRKAIDGSRAVSAAREAVEAAAAEIRTSRSTRQARRTTDHLGYCPIATLPFASGARPARQAITGRGGPSRIGWREPTHGTRGRRAVRLPTCTLDERLLARIDLHVREHLDYRFEQRAEIQITRDPASVGVAQSDYLDWDYYAKSCKYPKKIVSSTITAPRDWISRVERVGLANVGGMLTLDAQRLEGGPDGIALYAARWLVQGRGYDLHTETGIIALGRGEEYHGRTPELALRGLRRKLGLKAADAALADLLAHHGLDEVVAAHPDLTVSVSDARATGSCEYGIRSWCHASGLPYEAGVDTLERVYSAYRARPLGEARAAILHALRRQRRALKLAA